MNIVTGLRAFIARHPVPSYFAVTFANTLGGFLIAFGPGGLPIRPEQLTSLSVGVAMLAGPAAAGLLLTGLVSGRAGFRDLLSRLLRWRVGARWYAVALLTAPLLNAAILLVLSRLSPEFLPAIVTTEDKVSLLLAGMTVGLMVGFFEELGWTGFAIPRLRLRYGVLVTGLIVGLLWGAWHFLMFLEGDSFSGALPLALLLVRLFSWLPAYRVLVVWVYDRTESLLLAMLMHASAVAGTFLFAIPATGAAFLTSLLAWAAALWILVAVVVVANGGRLSRDQVPGAGASRALNAIRDVRADDAGALPGGHIGAVH